MLFQLGRHRRDQLGGEDAKLVAAGLDGLQTVNAVGLDEDHVPREDLVLLPLDPYPHASLQKKDQLKASVHVHGEGEILVLFHREILRADLVLQLIKILFHGLLLPLLCLS